ncbi:MAG TPA: AzlD domain-containing protein [Gemmatimonadaceae bacterium]|nr:AzlD domain-containing protein [Gemmatimonadaceae bacterium]
MSRAWLLALCVGAATMSIKAGGTLLRSERRSSSLFKLSESLTPFLLPGVLTALIVVQVFSTSQRLTLDARVAGLVAAIFLARFRAPPVITLGAAALVTALARLAFAQAAGGQS